jgi:hypothetical protein
MPASGRVPKSDTVKALSRSFVASTISKTGEIVPVTAGWSGLETKARNLSPLRPRWLGELEPLQDAKIKHSTIRTEKALKVFFNPGTPNSIEG